MKKLTQAFSALLLAITIVTGISTISNAASGVALNSKNFPDANFLKYVKQFDLNKDGSLSKDEISKVTTINCDSLSIKSIEGINYFSSLKDLSVNKNQLKSIDVSKINTLLSIMCFSNQLTEIKLSKEADIKSLHCGGNKLSGVLDVSAYTNLGFLDCSYNEGLTNIRFPVNASYTYQLFCQGTSINSLDIAMQPLLVDAFNATKTTNVKYRTKDTTLSDHYKLDGHFQEIWCNAGTKIKSVLTRIDVKDIKAGSTTAGNSTASYIHSFAGDKVTITAKANSGYKFTGWIDLTSPFEIFSTNPTISFTAENNKFRQFEAVFELIPTPTPTKKPTPTPTLAPNMVTRPSDAKTAFINNLYDCTMERLPDEDGFNYWSDLLYSFEISGADAVKSFVCTPEFEAKNYDNDKFVTVLYKIFFDREPDQDGLAYWNSQLAAGSSRVQIIDGFVNSQEWADKSALYGIKSGTTIKTANNFSPNKAIQAFVNSMYSIAFERKPDSDGAGYWMYELSAHRVTGEFVASFFLLSDEMQSYEYINDTYLLKLYEIFLLREPEEDGFYFWLDKLNAGTSRAEVVAGFSRSQEFIDLCKQSGIEPY